MSLSNLPDLCILFEFIMIATEEERRRRLLQTGHIHTFYLLSKQL